MIPDRIHFKRKDRAKTFQNLFLEKQVTVLMLETNQIDIFLPEKVAGFNYI